MSDRFVLRANYGPPTLKLYNLRRETPKQKDWVVRVIHIESAQLLMKEGYDLVEDPRGQIDASKMPLTVDEAAEVLGVAKSTVYKYRQNGKLNAKKDSEGQYRISRADVLELKEKLQEE